jgi:hypothetical protein
MKLSSEEKLALILVVLGVLSRLLPMPPNLTIVTGITLLAGYGIRNIWLALLVPVATMALADVLLPYVKPEVTWYAGVLWTYAGMVAGVLLARWLLAPLTTIRLVATTFLASLTFFVLSNLGTWFEGWYGYTLEGLVACFVAAIPFWQTSLIADFVSSAGAFGLFLLAKRYTLRRA